MGGLAAAWATARTFAGLLALPDWAFVVLGGVLAAPYAALLGNRVLSEPLAYPLFLLWARHLLRGLARQRARDLAVAAGLAALLVLARRQLLFVDGVAIVALLVLFVQRARKRVKLAFVAALAAATLAGELAERLYHEAYHDHFIDAPFTGVNVAVAPLYVSAPADAAVLPDGVERRLFVEVRAEVEDAHLALPARAYIDPYLFARDFDRIVYDHLLPAAARLGVGDPVVLDGLLDDLALRLLGAHPALALRLYARTFVAYLGGYHGVLLVVVLFAAAAARIFVRRDALALLGLLASAVALGNALLVSLAQAYHERYALYADALLVVFVVAAFARAATTAPRSPG